MSVNDFLRFGNGNGNRKFHSQSSGTERELKNPIPKIWEREGNKKIHSHNLGTGISGMGMEGIKHIDMIIYNN